MDRRRFTNLVWRWDDTLGGPGWRVVFGDLDGFVVGLITPDLTGECWLAQPLPMGEEADPEALPARAFRDLEAAESYLEAHGHEADTPALFHLHEA